MLTFANTFANIFALVCLIMLSLAVTFWIIDELTVDFMPPTLCETLCGLFGIAIVVSLLAASIYKYPFI